MESPVVISFIEDRKDVLEFLAESFAKDQRFTVRGQYTSAEEAITFLPQSETNVAIVDINLPGKSGIECVREIKKKRPEMLFMMFTVIEHENELFESLKVGADGYLLKTTDEEELIDAVQELLAGGSPMTPSIARKVTLHFREQKKGLSELSRRENEVLEKLANGLSYREIGTQLNITEGTVKQHIHKIYNKLHVSNRTEASLKWWQRGGRIFGG